MTGTVLCGDPPGPDSSSAGGVQSRFGPDPAHPRPRGLHGAGKRRPDTSKCGRASPALRWPGARLPGRLRSPSASKSSQTIQSRWSQRCSHNPRVAGNLHGRLRRCKCRCGPRPPGRRKVGGEVRGQARSRKPAHSSIQRQWGWGEAGHRRPWKQVPVKTSLLPAGGLW